MIYSPLDFFHFLELFRGAASLMLFYPKIRGPTSHWLIFVSWLSYALHIIWVTIIKQPWSVFYCLPCFFLHCLIDLIDWKIWVRWWGPPWCHARCTPWRWFMSKTTGWMFCGTMWWCLYNSPPCYQTDSDMCRHQAVASCLQRYYWQYKWQLWYYWHKWGSYGRYWQW